jgi:hypothetical protein
MYNKLCLDRNLSQGQKVKLWEKVSASDWLPANNTAKTLNVDAIKTAITNVIEKKN